MAEIVEALELSGEDTESKGEAMKAMISTKGNQKEAILMMNKSISLLLESVKYFV